MKKILAFSALLIIVLFFGSCRHDPKIPEAPIAAKPNPCDTVNCQNGGICDDGTCMCPTGYSGAHCEIYYTTLWEGRYKSDNFNCGIFPIPGDADVQVNPKNKDQLLLPNGLVADIIGNKFVVQPMSFSAAMIWGDGFFEDDKMFLKLNFGSPITGVLATCQGDFYKMK
ncbi:MAG: hypothetical protein EOP53_09460 [Sphingobacteriales bacterium]|nr:MAG: hypothetical protein EOP53_09460 [Sphingobacteriales bacterium]